MSAWLESEMCDNRTKYVIINIILSLLLLLLLFYYYLFIYGWQNNTQTKCTQLIIVKIVTFKKLLGC